MFASTELAAQIERAEVGLLSACARGCARRRGLDVYAAPLAGGLAVHAIEGSPLNKVAGLGFHGPVDAGALAEVERAIFARGGAVQVELSTVADPSIAPLLCRRGYGLVGFENVLGRPLTRADKSAPPGLSIELADDDALDLWIDVMVTGFLAPDSEGVASHESFPRAALTAAMTDVAHVDGFRRYLVRDRDGRVIAGGSARFTDGVAQLCGAATLPAWRRRGAQTLLLATRLADAAKAGCELAVMTTQPASKSMANALRRGFALLYARAVLVRES
ncbi:MAG: GNAT family N-acetyltransferase [Myxococcales bacterium]|nr:GNAT family N-acetyltransferase [Myxococcales bacterium]